MERANGMSLEKLVGLKPLRMEEIKHVSIKPYDYEGYCFTLDMPERDFLFCKDKQHEIEEFKTKLTT